MKETRLPLVVTIFVLTFFHLASAQQNKVPTVGLLLPGSLSYGEPIVEAFRQGLRDLGYTEGKNIVIEYRTGEGKLDRYSQLATELVNLRVDVIVTSSTPAIQAAKNATKTIPIVMAAAADPVGTGLVASLAHPGGNITGSSMRSPEVSGKRLELIKEIAPKARRVGVLWSARNAASEYSLTDSQVAAQAIGFQLQSVKIQSPHDFDWGFDELIRGRAEAFTVFRDSLLLMNLNRLLAFATKHQLPAVYDGREFALAGGLMSYTPNHLDLYRRAATYVDRILKGAKPRDLPVEQTMRAEFIINLKTADATRIKIPPEMLQRADKVIR
jgi:putative ABC transport system substrate-binding protein